MLSSAALVRTVLGLRNERRTGLLTVDADGVRTFIYLKAGVPIFAEEGTQGETLGRMLVRQEKLTQAQHAQVIAAMTDALVLNEQLRFGEVAVELGFLTEDQVRKALYDQVRWKIVRTFQRAQLTWTFEDSESVLDDVGNFPMRLEALFLAAVRWLDDDQKAELGLKRYLEDALVVPDHPNEVASRFELTAAERSFLDGFDGRRTVRELLASSGSSDVDAPAIVCALIVTRCVAKAAPAAPPAPARPPSPPASERSASAAKRAEDALSERAIPVARPATPAEAHAPLARPATPLQPIPIQTSARPTLKQSDAGGPAVSAKPTLKQSHADLLDGDAHVEVSPADRLAPPAPAPSSVPAYGSGSALPGPKPPSSTPGTLGRSATAQPFTPSAAPGLQRPATGVPMTPRAPMKTRASQILAALEHKRVKADPQRDPANEHEAKLLAERAHQEGLAEMKAGRWAQALPALQRAAQLLPSSDEYKLLAKWAAVQASQARSGEPAHKIERDELARIALAVIKADPNSAFAFYVAGHMSMLAEELVPAHKLLGRAVKLDPKNLDAQRLFRIVERRVKGEDGSSGGGGLLSKKLW